jgi:hypothetical protein
LSDFTDLAIFGEEHTCNTLKEAEFKIKLEKLNKLMGMA